MPRDTRRRLIDVAADLFYRVGFQAVGLDQILTTVGITKTAFYKHFESKDDLIIAVLKHRDRIDFDDSLAYMRLHGGSDPHGQIMALFDLLGEWFAQPDFRGCLFMNAATEFPSPNDPIHRTAAAHADHLAAEVLLRVQAVGLPDAEVITRQLMLLIAGAIAARHANGVADAAAIAKGVARSMLAVQPPTITLVPARRRTAGRAGSVGGVRRSARGR